MESTSQAHSSQIPFCAIVGRTESRGFILIEIFLRGNTTTIAIIYFIKKKQFGVMCTLRRNGRRNLKWIPSTSLRRTENNIRSGRLHAVQQFFWTLKTRLHGRFFSFWRMRLSGRVTKVLIYKALHRWSNTFVKTMDKDQKEKDRSKDRLCKRAFRLFSSYAVFFKYVCIRMLNTPQWASSRVLSTRHVYGVGKKNSALEINPKGW